MDRLCQLSEPSSAAGHRQHLEQHLEQPWLGALAAGLAQSQGTSGRSPEHTQAWPADSALAGSSWERQTRGYSNICFRVFYFPDL